MSSGKIGRVALVLLLWPMVTMAALTASAPADAKSRNRYDSWEDRRENRRDARRAGIVAGMVAGGIARSAANDRAEQRYQECVMASGYDYECERRRYEDEMRGRRAGRRSAWVVGVTAREIVRD